MGFEVVTVERDPAWHPDICVDVLKWEFCRLPRGQFQVIFASPPCTEYSKALTTRPRDLQAAHALVWQTLKIIRHFCPQQWFIENPHMGKLSSRPGMKDYLWIYVDHCQFSDWGYQKPTRIWGMVRHLENVTCDGKTCPHLIPGTQRHQVSLGGASKRLGRNEEYRIPSAVVKYLLTGRRPALHILPGSERTSEGRRVRVGDVVIGENMEKGKTQGPVIRVGVILPRGLVRVLEALIDTGAMCNLIREGIPSPHMLQPTPSPM